LLGVRPLAPPQAGAFNEGVLGGVRKHSNFQDLVNYPKPFSQAIEVTRIFAGRQ